jgi:hypothetical protein
MSEVTYSVALPFVFSYDGMTDAKLVRKFGDVPDDLSARLRHSSFRGTRWRPTCR